MTPPLRLTPLSCQAIVHMESMVGVLRDYDSFPPEFRPMYEAMRSASGERVFLRGDALPRLAQATFGDKLSAEQLREYTRAYENPGDDRKPFLTLSRDIPTRTDGPWEMVSRVLQLHTWYTWRTQTSVKVVEQKQNKPVSSAGAHLNKCGVPTTPKHPL